MCTTAPAHPMGGGRRAPIKWNEVHKDGQKSTVNDDSPVYVENRFTAVWNHNLGFHPASEAGKVPTWPGPAS
ncbi:hypothetical protein [Streptomyces sp. NPDC001843]|uniref:hypothetical protein n=1 Tax=Streptomyces sp. NPDC001843 TaxID=3364617 RepID=UPI0036BA4806